MAEGVVVKLPVARGPANRNQSPRPREAPQPFDLRSGRLGVPGGVPDRERQLDQIRRFSTRILWCGDLEVEVLQAAARIADVHELCAPASLLANMACDWHAPVADAKHEIGPRRTDRRAGVSRNDVEAFATEGKPTRLVEIEILGFERKAQRFG